MKKLTKAKWEKPDVSKLSVKNLTLGGVKDDLEGKDVGASRRVS